MTLLPPNQIAKGKHARVKAERARVKIIAQLTKLFSKLLESQLAEC
jgi:hypothetical protein